MKTGTIEYTIYDIDYFECDAFVTFNGFFTFYFQFPEGKEPTIEDALQFLKNDGKDLEEGWAYQ